MGTKLVELKELYSCWYIYLLLVDKVLRYCTYCRRRGIPYCIYMRMQSDPEDT